MKLQKILNKSTKGNIDVDYLCTCTSRLHVGLNVAPQRARKMVPALLTPGLYTGGDRGPEVVCPEPEVA
jgi:hypothetical protein